MHYKSAVRTLVVGIGVALLATACTPEGVSAPQSLTASAATGVVVAPLASTHPDAVPATAAGSGDAASFQMAVTRKHALKSDITKTQVIGSQGGKIKIDKAGLTVVFSPGALLRDTPITVTANAGTLVSYEFGPHGTQFHAPVNIEQDMKQTTSAKKLRQANTLFGGYMVHGVSDIVGDSVKVTELHKSDTKIGKDSLGRPELKKSTFVVSHFSGYILISTRR